MKSLSNIVKNTGALLLGTLTRMAASFVLLMIIARHQGATGMGTFAVVISLFWFFAKIAPAGLEPLLIREISKHKSKTNDYYINGLGIALICALAMMLIMFLFVNIANYSKEIIVSTYYISGALIFTTINVITGSVFIAYDQSKYVFYCNLTENSLKLLLGLFVLVMGYGIPTLALVISFSSMGYLILALWLLQKKIFKIKLHFDFSLLKSIIKTLPTFTGMQIVTAFSGNITVIALSLLMSVEHVGYYSAAMRLVNVFLLIVQSYRLAIQPTAARTFQESVHNLKKFCIKSLKYILMLTVPVSIGIMFLAPRVLVLFFSEQFIASTPLMRILVWTLPFNGLSFVLTSILIASNLQKLNLRVILISTIFQITLVFILIPLMGYYGAALSVLLGNVATFVLKYISISRNLFQINYYEILKNTMLASAVMAAALWALNSMNMFLLIGIGMFIYFTMLMVLGELKAKNFKFLKIEGFRRGQTP